MDPWQSIRDELHRLDEDGLRRALRTLPASGGKFEWNGRPILNFSSNDYLNLANDPRLKCAARGAVERWGCGATASRLMAGHLAVHEELEACLADLVGHESALVFPTGYQTNIGVLTALASEGDAIFSDELNHASIIDGCRLSRARVYVYRHRDADHLEHMLRTSGAARRRVIVTDSVFSMDGDLAPLRDLSGLARRHDALLVVDEAHAIGVFGDGGGLCRELGVRADVVVGTLSKALGGEGGFAAADRLIRDLLINTARSFIFSTGLAPACAAAALAAADIVENSPGLGRELLANSAKFRSILREKGLDVPGDRSQIIPLIVGDNHAALELSRVLLDRGILAAAVRPPSVPPNAARLRFSITLAHKSEDFGRVGEAVRDIAAFAVVR